jgi:hypothetical protein
MTKCASLARQDRSQNPGEPVKPRYGYSLFPASRFPRPPPGYPIAPVPTTRGAGNVGPAKRGMKMR